MRGTVHICSFATTDHLRESTLTYEAIKAAVLETGQFSAFEANATPKRAALFTRLIFDPALEVTALGYPWTRVIAKATKP